MNEIIVNQLSFFEQPLEKVQQRARMENLNAQLPPIRCSATTRQFLDRQVAEGPGKLADYIRQPLDRAAEGGVLSRATSAALRSIPLDTEVEPTTDDERVQALIRHFQRIQKNICFAGAN